MAETAHTHRTTNSPDILPFTFMNAFLKKSMKDPTMTTGCILVGSSPNIISMANDNISARTTKQNIVNDVYFINITILLYSIIINK